jgi:hypothetical protein
MGVDYRPMARPRPRAAGILEPPLKGDPIAPKGGGAHTGIRLLGDTGSEV